MEPSLGLQVRCMRQLRRVKATEVVVLAPVCICASQRFVQRQNVTPRKPLVLLAWGLRTFCALTRSVASRRFAMRLSCLSPLM